MVGKLQCRALSLVALGSASYVILYIFQDDGRGRDVAVRRCRQEHWSCAVDTARGPGSCADLAPAECEGKNGSNGTWLGLEIPSSWRPDLRFSNCFSTGDQLACLPQLINLAPPKSGTTKIYQQLLSLETVIPSGTPPKSLCEGRPLAWCQKEPTFWMKGTARLTRLQDYTSMYQPLSEKLQGSNRSEPLMSVDWSPLNYEANPLVLRHAHPSPHFVALLRNPIQRAESDYNWSFFAVAPSCRKMPSKGAASLAALAVGSARHMHQLMSKTVQHFGACLEREGSQSLATAERLCWHRSTEDRIISCSSYRTTSAYVLRGLYSVYLRWFLEHFAARHFTVARIEDVADDLHGALGPALRLGTTPAAAAPRPAPVLETQRHQVQLLPETTELLKAFYTPFVKDLQVLFNDTKLSWW